MQSWQKILMMAAIAGWALKPRQKNLPPPGGNAGGSSDPSTSDAKFHPVLRPMVLRNDTWGAGHYKASRGSRKHLGIDLRCSVGQTVYSPIYGRVTRRSNPYANDTILTGCKIQGTGVHAGYSMKIWYMQPTRIGEAIIPGSHIGYTQAVSKKYSPNMQDHVHLELRYQNQIIDPTPFFNIRTT